MLEREPLHGDEFNFFRLHAAANILPLFEQRWLQGLLSDCGAILLSDPSFEINFAILISCELKDSSSSLHAGCWTVSSMSCLSSEVKFDSIVISPVVVVVIMAAESCLDVSHLFEGSIETCIDREAADLLFLVAKNVLSVYHVHVFRQGDVEESKSLKYLTIFFDEL